LGYLTAFFNSKLFRFAFKDYFPELLGDTRELSKIFFENIRVIPVNDIQDKVFTELVDEIAMLKDSNRNSLPLEGEIEDILAEIYSISKAERILVGTELEPALD
jgi:hypothetical protein